MGSIIWYHLCPIFQPSYIVQTVKHDLIYLWYYPISCFFFFMFHIIFFGYHAVLPQLYPSYKKNRTSSLRTTTRGPRPRASRPRSGSVVLWPRWGVNGMVMYGICSYTLWFVARLYNFFGKQHGIYNYAIENGHRNNVFFVSPMKRVVSDSHVNFYQRVLTIGFITI